MTTPPLPTFPLPAGKTEWKVRIATLVTWLVTFLGSIALSTWGTDYVSSLPDWLENIIYPTVVALGTFLSGRAASTRPEYLSPSTVQAVEEWLRKEIASGRRLR